MNLLLLLPLLSTCIAKSFAFECITCNANAGDDDTKECVEEIEECEPGVESCSMVAYVSSPDNQLHMRKFCTPTGTPIYQYLLFFPGSALCQNIGSLPEPKFPEKFDSNVFSEEIFPPAEPPVDPEFEIDEQFNETNPVPPPSSKEFKSSKESKSKSRAFGPPGIRPPPDFKLSRAKRVRRSGAAPPAPPQAQRSSLLCVCSSARCNSGLPEQVLSRSMLNNLPFTLTTPEVQVDDSALQNVSAQK
ncbi:unnamed protein product [Bursaphelenchus xylophilus]|uniref:(pine wood nematode) hypothetical protein n=1 Tax=Bursaphelenchus xylophilus TaxID=6326 RepID=A0A1I7S2P7_BURXY|nr:unnamed protein product [Bursaphelenchus xylophilus]CAG9121755.1 unnamed protein product [Bursaphelenchus xylophilus]